MQGYISECRDPYSNIAFERELLLARQKTVFLWINDPCVIIGRNQNPWAEADIEYANTQNITPTTEPILLIKEESFDLLLRVESIF